MHSKLQTLEGIVLGSSSYGDSDKIITIFTKEKGKVRGIAKGIKKLTSKKRPALEPFTHVNVQITKLNLGIITEAQAINNFTNIRSDLTNVGVAYFFCESINRSFGDENPQVTIFNLLLSSLQKIDAGGTRKKVKDEFTKDLLVELGFFPENSRIQDLSHELENVLERKLGSVRIGKMIQ